MKCEDVSELLPMLLAGTLGRAKEQEVLIHLARCGECRAELAFWAKIAEAVKKDAANMPDGLFKNIRVELAGYMPATLLGIAREAWRALGLAGSACRLALSAAGLNH